MSPYYIDFRVVPSFPDVFHKVCETCVETIRRSIGVRRFARIAGVPTAGIPFASVVAYNLNKPLLYARLINRTHGRERRVEGQLISGDKILLLDDLITSGKSLLKAAEAVRAEGGVIDEAVVLIDREEGGKKALEDNRIRLHSLLRVSEAAKSLNQVGAITDIEFQTIMKQTRKN
jgi:orotate phosphoribosyltransferase